ncbi:MAG: efflux RND transporter periplasmic adaptor subunit [Dehalococcoidia bacterium]
MLTGARVRILIISLAAIALVAAAFVAVRWRGSTSTPAAPDARAVVSVQVAEVVSGPIRSSIRYAGTVRATGSVNLAPKMSGQVASIAVDAGSVVRAGDRLATLDSGTLAAQVAQAQAGLAAAEARLAVVQDGATAADIATATQAVLAAENAYTTAQLALDALQTGAGQNTQYLAAKERLAAVSAQLNTARADLDAAPEPTPARGPVVHTAVTDMEALLRERCSTVAARDACLGIAGAAAGAAQLLATIDAQTTGAPDMGAGIASYNSLVPTAAVALQEAAFRYLQASASLPALAARVDSLAFAVSRAGVPSTDQMDSGVRARDAAAAALAAARSRLKTLTSGPTNADLLTSRAAVTQAQASLAVAQTALSQTSVTAPFDGVIAQKLVEVGASVSPSAPMFVLTSKAVELHVTIEESRIGSVRPDLEATLTVPAYPGRTFRGRVGPIAPSGDARAHTFDVTVYASDSEGQLRPGMSADVAIVTADRPAALLVPNAALIQSGSGNSVMAVEDGKAKLKPVKVGLSDGAKTEITEGLRAGDRVIVVGQNLARDGQPVRVSTPAARPQ